MSGKTCLITGATSGIGEAAAREIARRGATVIIVGRSRERCTATVESIQRETGNPSVEFLVADLSSQMQVRQLAREVLDRHDRLHVLINNAGALFALRGESVDGIEMTLALNHLAYFLLTNLLLETLQRSGSAGGTPARIINVSSSAHDDVRAFDFDDPQARQRRPAYGRSKLPSLMYTLAMPWAHPGVVQYAQTKLANLLFTAELARRLVGTAVTANALHPGFVASRFMDGNGALGWFMRRWAGIVGISTEEGATTVIHLACSNKVEGVSGQYFIKEQPAAPSEAARDAAAASLLWRLSEEWTGLAQHQ